MVMMVLNSWLRCCNDGTLNIMNMVMMMSNSWSNRNKRGRMVMMMMMVMVMIDTSGKTLCFNFLLSL